MSCSQENESFISEDKFIPLYANILIINQLNVDADYHDILIAELLEEYKVKVIDIQNTIEHYQKNPELWIKVLDKIKAHFIELKKNIKPKTMTPEKNTLYWRFHNMNPNSSAGTILIMVANARAMPA